MTVTNYEKASNIRLQIQGLKNILDEVQGAGIRFVKSACLLNGPIEKALGTDNFYQKIKDFKDLIANELQTQITELEAEFEEL